MLTWGRVGTQGMLVPTRTLFARSRQPVPEVAHLPLRSRQAGLLAVPALHLAAVPSALGCLQILLLNPLLLFSLPQPPCTRQDPLLNASQACSRWCLSLTANKCFGAMIYLHKYHLSYRGQEGQLETPFLVDLHLVVISAEHTEFTLLQSVCYITIDSLFRFAQMHLKNN